MDDGEALQRESDAEHARREAGDKADCAADKDQPGRRDEDEREYARHAKFAGDVRPRDLQALRNLRNAAGEPEIDQIDYEDHAGGDGRAAPSPGNAQSRQPHCGSANPRRLPVSEPGGYSPATLSAKAAKSS